MIPGIDAVKLYSYILCVIIIIMYIWCLNSISFVTMKQPRCRWHPWFLYFLKKRCVKECDRDLFFWIDVQSVSGSFCMHHSGFVSYDCKNESSSHQLKYFIFTDLTVFWLSLHIIYDVSHSVTLLSSMKNISPLTFFFLEMENISSTELETQPHIALRNTQ